MERYETTVRNGVFYIETDADPLEVGTMEHIRDLIGSTYTIEYGERQRTQIWLDTDFNGRFTLDVCETLLDMDFTDEFVRKLADVEMETTEEGYPLRTVAFADRMTTIWDAKGALDDR